jgi:hypothetical protein
MGDAVARARRDGIRSPQDWLNRQASESIYIAAANGPVFFVATWGGSSEEHSIIVPAEELLTGSFLDTFWRPDKLLPVVRAMLAPILELLRGFCALLREDLMQ